jgi:hypothetical protein
VTVCAVTVMVAVAGIRVAGLLQVTKLASQVPPQIVPSGAMETADVLLEANVKVVLTVALLLLTAVAVSTMLCWP